MTQDARWKDRRKRKGEWGIIYILHKEEIEILGLTD